MAELLIVVAIIGVLGAIGVQVWNQRQRSLARLERDTIAREIFIAAQNHLTRAHGQGYLGLGLSDDGELAVDGDGNPDEKDYGYPDTNIKNEAGDPIDDVYYLVYPFDSDGTGKKMMNIILPPMSVDETVLGNGSYIIRYQRSTGRVLDVFYTTAHAQNYNMVLNADVFNAIVDSNYTEMSTRQDYNGAVLGWYGSKAGELINLDVHELKAPDIKVINAERLEVIVTDNNVGADPTSSIDYKLQLIVRGEVSGIEKVFTLKKESTDDSVSTEGDSYKDRIKHDDGSPSYSFILDDITREHLHFAELKMTSAEDESTFIPGENITIQAKAFSTVALANIGESVEKMENSLFAAIVGIDDKVNPAYTMANIGNMRHLENLHPEISGVDYSDSVQSILKDAGSLTKAEQLTDLDWVDFCENDAIDKTDKGVTIYDKNGKEFEKVATGFCPVNPESPLEYDGMQHSISNVWVYCEGPAGLFGEAKDKSDNAVSLKIHDLELIDFTITSSDDDAGALAGTLENCTIENVLVRELHGDVSGEGTSDGGTSDGGTSDGGTSDGDASGEDDTGDVKVKVKGNGSVGGLVGSISGTSSTVTKCAAAVIVESTNGSAGGLIGTAKDISVEASYSGGHCINGKDADNKDAPPVFYDPDSFNVTAAGAAGGLIGTASATEIQFCYSTCSASGATAGGFVGTADADSSVKNSYCTGLVGGSTIGAFTGSESIDATNCRYYEIINEIEDAETGGIKCLSALGSDKNDMENIKPLDALPDGWMLSDPEEWQSAYPYDTLLTKLYQGQYNLKTVEQLGATIQHEVRDESNENIITKPADFVIAHYGDWPAPETFVLNEAAASGGSGE